MAYALVGTIGVASQGTAGATVTPAWGTGESRTAGNLLICFCCGPGENTVISPPTGWSLGAQANASSGCSAEVFYKIATGGDAAPTLPALTVAVVCCQLAEFSGNASVPLDKTGSANGNTSPITATFGAADTASGELLIIATGDARSASRTPSDTLTSNHGTITQAGNNNGVSNANHYSFGYCLASTSNVGANTAILTTSVTTSLLNMSLAAATFLLPSAAPNVIPELFMAPMTPARWPRH